MHNCGMCPFFSVSQSELLAHIVRRHRHAAGFNVSCSADSCGRPFKNYISFKTHVKRSHRIDESDTGRHESHDAVDSETVAPDSFQSANAGNIRLGSLSEAAYILKLKTVHRLPHTTVSNIMNETKMLLSDKLSSINTALSENMGVDSSSDSRLSDAFNDNLFDGLQSAK